VRGINVALAVGKGGSGRRSDLAGRVGRDGAREGRGWRIVCGVRRIFFVFGARLRARRPSRDSVFCRLAHSCNDFNALGFGFGRGWPAWDRVVAEQPSLGLLERGDLFAHAGSLGNPVYLWGTQADVSVRMGERRF